MNRTISVVVVDDHPFFRDGLSRGLSASGRIRVVGEAADARSGIAAIGELQPDVAVVDYQMPGMTGIDLVHAVTRDGGATKVLLLSAVTDSVVVFDALREGAAGYMSKESDRDAIVGAVERVARGETVVPPELAAGLVTQIRAHAAPGAPTLSERESQVLNGFARGLSIPQIAAELYIGASTVKTHAGNLYQKLGVSDRAAAVAEGMRRHLIE
ncbi:two-component system response regulator, LuxR family [Gordonia polyisoprenivorans VH2]|uniref:Two-component system response regulator, LuxR family n=2 Tax=Gordonia polyisoprenivorans TaxID=84595 RepID=H6N0R9_GORPV|nr:response regulator transcription factor [Gordonia polyisoprenivorans]AFA73281.1 two-component system response regulator, LuxR family [Gordonia polyisoprenivorans VH2]NKY02248.1 response regulator transcription factor [Gordonia polyisoprenivorans]OZC30396.1 DNA-binding response regulator [Gordonia polyisoprenivorans]WCB39744.1 response regulator transcription factor [Gordonia polyisoprenivorans]GAB23623.1 putative two-component response regulator [Gordonia polyisoprenivorans NBRC 16320 = JCM